MYNQPLAPVPLQLPQPVWIVDPDGMQGAHLAHALTAQGVEIAADGAGSDAYKGGTLILVGTASTPWSSAHSWMAIDAVKTAHERGAAMLIAIDHLPGAGQALTAASGLSGLVKTAAREWPDLASLCLRTTTTDANEIAAALLSAGGGIGRDVQLSAAGLEVAHLAAVSPAGGTDRAPARNWIVTGGARGVTAACVIALSARTRAHFNLLGRTTLTPWPDGVAHTSDLATLRGALASQAVARGDKPKPAAINAEARRVLASDEVVQTLARIEAAGGTATYHPCDVSDAASVAEVVSGLGPVDGLIHGAGVIADRLIPQKTRADVDAVFAPKIAGLQAILAALDPGTLSHVGLFSSAAARFGNPGQADYAMANASLDAVAAAWRARYPHAIVRAYNWGPWAGGMVDETLANLFRQRGISLIPIAEGAGIFADFMASSDADLASEILVGDPWDA